MTRIMDLEDQIRQLINSPRKHRAIREDSAKYHKLCSSLDVIGDTELALRAFEEMSDDPRPGSSYILVYGFLQALVLQQDAVQHHYEALGLPYERDSSLKEIRDIRNDAVGHPTNRLAGKSFNHISRPSVSKSGFGLLIVKPNEEPPMQRHVDLKSLLDTQRAQLEKDLGSVLQELLTEAKGHRQRHRDEKLATLFPPQLSFDFEKVYEAAQGSRPWELGKIHLSFIGEVLEKFRAALEKRQVAGAYPGVEDQLTQLEYPLAQLSEYFAEKGRGRLSASDAQIFTSFLRQGMSQLQEMAGELDAEYSTETE